MEEKENSPNPTARATPSPLNAKKDILDNSPRSNQQHTETEGGQRVSPTDNDSELKSVNLNAHTRRFHSGGDVSQVTQSRSIFSPEDCFVYGNPKEIIRTIEPLPCEVLPEMQQYDSSSNVLDLSCKATSKTDNEKNESVNQETYQNYKSIPAKNYGVSLNSTGFATGSNMEIPLVNRKPSIPEQLQIAKLQRQQRKAAQQQQKMLQQMRRNLESAGKSADPNRASLHTPTHDVNQKNVKHFTSHEHSNQVLENSRKKDDRLSFPPTSYFSNPPYTYYDPVPSKELPDGHPILPLFDPVYFSALYNAHGYLPPSSPSIAAAFISTLHEVLPKLPSMFSPPTSNNNISPQKTHDQN